MLERLKEGLRAAVEKLAGARVVDEEAVKEFVRSIQRALLTADVNVKLVFDLSRRIEERALKEEPPPGLPRRDHVIKILYEELAKMLGEEGSFESPTDRPSVILLVGIQGSGKTTTAAKLARYFKKKGYRVGLVCADTYRPGALAQLRSLGELVGVEVFGGGSDPVEMARKGVEELKKKGDNLIIVDTAGRHKEEKGLLEEMRRISEALDPDYTVMVVDGTIGQQCYRQAEAFHSTTPIGGIIVSKLDGSAKGGGALAAVAATGAKILFVGSGERIDDLEPFSPTRFVGRLLGMGDIKSLLERARELEMEGDESRVRRMVSGRMTLEDFYYQLEQLGKVGPLRKLLEMIPGFHPTGEGVEELEGKLKIWKCVIQSMTKEERKNPNLMNSSRIRRVARGAGVEEKEVKLLLNRFKKSKELMRGRGMRMFLKRLGHEAKRP